MVATQTKTAQVTCINKPDRNSAVEAITHIGGETWKWPVERAITAIENGEWTFYTMVGGKKAIIAVRTSARGRNFLQTHADNQWNNNLLALAECR
jgi:hypothetical protein